MDNNKKELSNCNSPLIKKLGPLDIVKEDQEIEEAIFNKAGILEKVDKTIEAKQLKKYSEMNTWASKMKMITYNDAQDKLSFDIETPKNPYWKSKPSTVDEPNFYKPHPDQEKFFNLSTTEANKVPVKPSPEDQPAQTDQPGTIGGIQASPINPWFLGSLPKEPPTMWDFFSAKSVIRSCQELSRHYNYHMCLGGGVLNKGHSKKDLDLYFLPLDDGDKKPDPKGLLDHLQVLFFCKMEEMGGKYHKASLPYIFKGKLVQLNGRRIDVFVMGTENDMESVLEFMKQEGIVGVETMELHPENIEHFKKNKAKDPIPDLDTLL